jgi:hypothetical protein
MLLLGVADCCRLIQRFAFTDSVVLLISTTFGIDLPAFASFKRQTNGKVSQSFTDHRGGGVLIRYSKILLQRALDLPRYLPVTF